MKLEEVVKYKKMFKSNSEIAENKIFINIIISLNNSSFEIIDTNIVDKLNNKIDEKTRK